MKTVETLKVGDIIIRKKGNEKRLVVGVNSSHIHLKNPKTNYTYTLSKAYAVEYYKLLEEEAMKPRMPKVGDIYISKRDGKKYSIKEINFERPNAPILIGYINRSTTWYIDLEILNRNYVPKLNKMPQTGDRYKHKRTGTVYEVLNVHQSITAVILKRIAMICTDAKITVSLDTLSKSYTQVGFIGEKAMRQLPKKDRRWSFQAHHQNEINFDAIASELSKANPIAVVKWNRTEYIVMRNELHRMANEKDVDDSILIVKSDIEIRKINEEIYYLIIVYKDKDLPLAKDFIEWAKKVQRSPWPVKKADRTTKVIIPDLS